MLLYDKCNEVMGNMPQDAPGVDLNTLVEVVKQLLTLCPSAKTDPKRASILAELPGVTQLAVTRATVAAMPGCPLAARKRVIQAMVPVVQSATAEDIAQVVKDIGGLKVGD